MSASAAHRGVREEEEKAGGSCELTAASQPAEVDIVTLEPLRIDKKKDFLCLSEVARGCLGLCVVEVEHIIVEEVALQRVRGMARRGVARHERRGGVANLDGAEVDKHILKLSKKKEAGGHALAARDGVWVGRGYWISDSGEAGGTG